nr:hypothetical protein [Grapevine leafroll-associated virus 3]
MLYIQCQTFKRVTVSATYLRLSVSGANCCLL